MRDFCRATAYEIPARFWRPNVLVLIRGRFRKCWEQKVNKWMLLIGFMYVKGRMMQLQPYNAEEFFERLK
jgi:hypothetical protein